MHSLLGRKRRIGRHSATLPSPGTSAGSSAGTREPHCNQVVAARFARRNRGKSHSCRSTATVSPLSPQHKFGEHYTTSPGPGEAAGPPGRVCGRGGTRVVAARFAVTLRERATESHVRSPDVAQAVPGRQNQQDEAPPSC